MTAPLTLPLVARPLGPNLNDFLLFCESQPPEKTYDYESITRCACAQYNVTICGSWYDEKSSHDENEFWCEANFVAGQGRHTFGALTERLREDLGV